MNTIVNNMHNLSALFWPKQTNRKFAFTYLLTNANKYCKIRQSKVRIAKSKYERTKYFLKRRNRIMMTKRIVSLLLAVMMIVAVIPAGIIAISAEDTTDTTDTTYTAVELTPDSWLCETDPDSDKSKEAMITEDGKNFYYPDPRTSSEIGSSDEGYITSVKDYIFADGFKFTFDANVCRAGCDTWGCDAFTLSFGSSLTFVAGAEKGFIITANGKEYKYDLDMSLTGNKAPASDDDAKKLNTTYTIEYNNKEGKVTLTTGSLGTINFGKDIVINAVDFAAGKIQFWKCWTYTKANITNAEQLATSNYKVDFLIFSNVALSMPGNHIHTYGEYVSNNDATCAKDATKTATCTVEGCGQTNTVIIPDSALGHSFKENGNGTKTCSVCGKTLTAVEFTRDSWLCETDPESEKSTYPMAATEDGKNFYYQAPRGDEKSSSNNEIGSSDEGIITSVDDYIFADGFKFTFDANVCRAGCASWGVTLFSISFGTAVNFKVDIDTGYNLTVNDKTYTKNPGVPCSSNWAPKTEDDINGTYTVEYMDGKLTVKLNGEAIDFGQDILIDAEDFAAGKIQFEKGWTWTKVAKDSYDPADYATDFLIFSKVTFEKVTAAPVYEGVQDAKVGDVLSVRFVGTVKDLNYSKVGFKITAMDGEKPKSWTQETTTVYSSLIGNTDTGVKIYDKTNLHGQYIYALTIKGVPTTGTVTFNVTAYGIVDGKEVTDRTFAVIYTDGLYVKTVVIA